MNKAGHLQKYCPGEGGILLVKDVVEKLAQCGKKLWKVFCLKSISIKGKSYSCYYYPFNSESKNS